MAKDLQQLLGEYLKEINQLCYGGIKTNSQINETPENIREELIKSWFIQILSTVEIMQNKIKDYPNSH